MDLLTMKPTMFTFIYYSHCLLAHVVSLMISRSSPELSYSYSAPSRRSRFTLRSKCQLMFVCSKIFPADVSFNEMCSVAEAVKMDWLLTHGVCSFTSVSS